MITRQLYLFEVHVVLMVYSSNPALKRALSTMCVVGFFWMVAGVLMFLSGLGLGNVNPCNQSSSVLPKVMITCLYVNSTHTRAVL